MPAEFAPGNRVLVHSLVGRPELNGRSGTIASYDARKGRFAVKVEKGAESESMLLKPSNLHLAPAKDEDAGSDDGIALEENHAIDHDDDELKLEESPADSESDDGLVLEDNPADCLLYTSPSPRD